VRFEETNRKPWGFKEVLTERVLDLGDDVWRWVGSRHSIQVEEETGWGFKAWYWRSSIAYVEGE
jgi:hypothetical protein